MDVQISGNESSSSTLKFLHVGTISRPDQKQTSKRARLTAAPSTHHIYQQLPAGDLQKMIMILLFLFNRYVSVTGCSTQRLLLHTLSPLDLLQIWQQIWQWFSLY
jgi:hypothetical protein